jgi:hypothetical protein
LIDGTVTWWIDKKAGIALVDSLQCEDEMTCPLSNGLAIGYYLEIFEMLNVVKHLLNA